MTGTGLPLFISVSSLFVFFFSFVILYLWWSFTLACFQYGLKPLFIFLPFILHFAGPLDKWVIKSLKMYKVYERNRADNPTHRDVLWAIQILLCRNKSKLFMGTEAKCHENHQHTDRFNNISASTLSGWVKKRSLEHYRKPPWHTGFHRFEKTC